MRFQFILAVCASSLCLAGCGQSKAPVPASPSPREPQPIASASAATGSVANVFHFAGASALATNSHASNLVQLARIPSVGLQFGECLQTLARNATNFLALPAPAKSDAGRLRTVFGDLFQHGFDVLWDGWGTDKGASWMLTSPLPPDRAEAAKRNLAAWLAGDQPAVIRSFPAGAVDGWVASLPAARLVFVVHEGKAVVLGGSWAEAAADVLQGSAASQWKPPAGSPEAPEVNGQPAWLYSRLNAQAGRAFAGRTRGLLALWIGSSTGQPFPSGERSVGGLKSLGVALSSVDHFVRTRVTCQFEQPPTMGSVPWQVPTNSIRDPLISFTAVQPAVSPFQQVFPWFGPQDFLALLGLEKEAGPMFAWGLGDVPFQFYAAVPFKNANERMAGLAASLETRWGGTVEKRSMGRIARDEKTGQVSWVGGLPMAVPFLAPAQDENYLTAGIFPMVPGTNSMPRELINQVEGRTNLLYYNWEITQGRLLQWKLLGQLLSMMRPSAGGQTGPPGLPVPASNAARGGGAWLNDLGAQLGNSVTELIVTSPDAWTLTRKSHSGLTALEWVLLDNWLSSAAFPSLELKADSQAPTPATGPAPPPAPVPPKPPLP